MSQSKIRNVYPINLTYSPGSMEKKHENLNRKLHFQLLELYIRGSKMANNAYRRRISKLISLYR